MNRPALLTAMITAAAVTTAATQSLPGPQQLPRDTPAPRQDTARATGLIAGRVVAADTGKPLARARVLVSAPGLSKGRGQLTDDRGLFEFSGLPAGRYTLRVSKPGFVPISYGQRRPL